MLSSCVIAQAQSIPIQNSSFESANLALAGGGTGLYSNVIANSTFPLGGTVSNWTGSATIAPADAGAFAPLPINWTADWWLGNNVGFVNIEGAGTVSLSQTLSATLQDNVNYTLSALVGRRASTPRFNYAIQLWAGTTMLASAGNLNLAANSFGQDSATYSSGANNPAAGQPLIVVLTSTGSDGILTEAFFDEIALTASSASGGTGCLPPPASMVGWWPGDTGENDIVGGNNATTAVGISLAPGEVLDGFTFASKGYIQVPSAPALANQIFTWTAWVRPDGPTPGNDNSNDAFGGVILAQNIDNDDDSVALSWSAKTDQFVFEFGNLLSASGYITSTDKFAAGQFYLAAVTYDGAVFRLYVNGTLEGSLTLSKTVTYSSSGWTFGSALPQFFSLGYTRTWNGVIDEIQAFSRALSQTEIQAIYNAGSHGVCKNTTSPTGPPAPSVTTAVSASAFGAFSSLAPGTWVEIYGSNLAGDTRTWAGSDFVGNQAPTSLDKTSVTVGRQPAFIDYISPTQVNALLASNTPTGSQQMVVTNANGAATQYTVMVNAVQPGLLSPSFFKIGAVQYVTALLPDGTYVLPSNAIQGLNSRPVKPGETITLYGVGFGSVTPTTPAGQLVQSANSLALPLQITIGGVPANFMYDGLAPDYTGLYQFNLTVPTAPAGNAALTFTLNGTAGTQTLYIPIGN